MVERCRSEQEEHMLRLSAAVLVPVLVGLLAGLFGGVAPYAQKAADDNAFPHTKANGRATVQYEDERVKAVAIYDYSQRHHDDSPWLLVQMGIALRQRTVVHRSNLTLVAPDRRVIPLATQEAFVADSARLRQFHQNARIFRREVLSYFPKSASGDSMRFFALPGQGTVSDEAVVPATQGVVVGDIYFKAPTGVWEDGVYRLVFDHELGRAELPIRLE
jgi:hypothetical protein